MHAESGTIIRDKGFLEPEQVNRIISACPNERDRLLVELLWYSGCRLSEAVDRKWGLRRKDLEFEPEPILFLRTLKRRGTPPIRRVLVPRAFINRLGEFSVGMVLERVIFGMSRQRAAQLIIRAGKLAGIVQVRDKPFHPHHLRHSHAIAYIRKDSTMEGLKKLQRRLGHSSIGTTGCYLEFADKQEAKKIEEIFKD